MLTDVVPVRWRMEADGVAIGTPDGAVPDLLRTLDRPAASDLLALAGRRHPPDGIRLRPGQIFDAAGVVSLVAPLDFLPESGVFRLTPAHADERANLWREAQAGPALRPAALRIGCGGALTARRLGGEVAERLGLAREEDGWVDPDERFFSRAIPFPARLPDRPDALAFHDDAMPVPLTLTLEVTTACNFRCVFCCGRHLPQGYLRWHEFLAVLDHLPDLRAVEITGEGEPLLNPDLLAMIGECKRRGLWVHLTTNGSQFDRVPPDRLIDLGLDSLAFSLESVDEALFRALRPGGEFAGLDRAIRRVAEARRRRRHGPRLLLWVTVLRRTLDELERILAFAETVGIDLVEVQTLNPLAAYRRVYPPSLASDLLSSDEIRALAGHPRFSAGARAVLDDLVRINEGRVCDIFGGSVMVYWQGVMTPCRTLKVPSFPAVGSLVKDSLRDLWLEPSFRRFRFALRHGAVLESCDGCPHVDAC